MSRTRRNLALTLILATALAWPAAAEHHEGEAKPAKIELSGYLADFKADFEFASGRLNQLAEAFAADQYGWRPAEGIRSVSEVFVHVASANYFFAQQFGVGMPDGFGMDAEKTITAKDDVIASLERSQEHMLKAMANAIEKDLDEEVMLFGRNRTWRSVLMIVSGHAHEHLGQAIAYARSTGVVPPWSAPQPPDEEGGADEESGDG